MHVRFLFLFLSSIGMLAMASSTSAQTVKGDQLFKQRCQACHAIKPGASALLGPNLAGVVGRKAGSTDFRYSPALKATNIKWNVASLDQFLTKPSKLVPGTRMVLSVTDPAQRKAIIDYLATVR